jgi:hypothetical protein
VNRQYKVTLSEAQVDVILRALDMYSRLGCGQFEEIDRLFQFDPRRNPQSHGWETRQKLDALKQLFLPLPGNASYSICSQEVPVDFRLAWDVHQTLRHHVSWERHPEGGVTVNFREPMNVSGETLCTIETVVPPTMAEIHAPHVNEAGFI